MLARKADLIVGRYFELAESASKTSCILSMAGRTFVMLDSDFEKDIVAFLKTCLF